MIRVVPAIDLIDGQAIRLEQGDFTRQTSIGRELKELLDTIKQTGLKDLHLVNLSAAKERRLRDLGLIAEIAAGGLYIDYGGGVRSLDDVEELLDLGIKEVNIGSMIVKEPKVFENILRKYPDKIIASLDVVNDKVAVSAWQEQSEISIYALLEKYRDQGLRKACVTDISKDGMMAGPSLSLYKDLLSRFPSLKLIASGGVRNKKDVDALDAIGCEALVVGKAWLSGEIELSELC